MTNAQIREIRVNNNGTWYVATRTTEVPTWDNTPKFTPNTSLYIDATIENVGGSQSPSDTYKASIEMPMVHYYEVSAPASQPTILVYGTFDIPGNPPSTAKAKIRGYDGNGTPTDTITITLTRQDSTTPPPSTNPSLAARFPIVGNRAIVQVYLRRLRDKVFTKKMHQKLHPLI